MNFSLRKAVAADAARISEIERDSGLEPWPPGEYALETDRDDSAFLVAVESASNRIIAFLLTRLITINDHAAQFPRSIREGEILNFAVDPLFRRGRVASALFEALVSDAEPAVMMIHLEVRAANSGAREFYRRHGFAETGIRARFYRDPEDDAILMTWKRESGPA